MAIHKLGYLWIWKKSGIIDEIKRNWDNRGNLIHLVESCVFDAIIENQFSLMDDDFKQKLNYLRGGYSFDSFNHWYKMTKDTIELPRLLYMYISQYLSFCYNIPDWRQNIYLKNMLYRLLKIRFLILEKSQIKHVFFSKRDFILLHKLLRKFDLILGFKDYKRIEQYIFQLHDIFNRLPFRT